MKYDFARKPPWSPAKRRRRSCWRMTSTWRNAITLWRHMCDVSNDGSRTTSIWRQARRTVPQLLNEPTFLRTNQLSHIDSTTVYCPPQRHLADSRSNDEGSSGYNRVISRFDFLWGKLHLYDFKQRWIHWCNKPICSPMSKKSFLWFWMTLKTQSEDEGSSGFQPLNVNEFTTGN